MSEHDARRWVYAMRRVAVDSRRLFVVLTIAVTLVSARCRENIHARYGSIESLRRADRGAQTWFPKTLPDTARELEVWYNLDTNGAVGRLDFDSRELPQFRNRLSVARTHEPFEPAHFRMRDIQGWPDCLDGRVSQAAVVRCGLEAYHVQGFQVVVNPHGTAYFWTTD